MLSVDDAVRLTGRPRAELEDLARRRVLRVVRVDGEWRLSLDALERAGLVPAEEPAPSPSPAAMRQQAALIPRMRRSLDGLLRRLRAIEVRRPDARAASARATAVASRAKPLGARLKPLAGSLGRLDRLIVAVGALCVFALLLFVGLSPGAVLLILLIVVIGGLLLISSRGAGTGGGTRTHRGG
jgi:hypothetical protein